MKKYVIVKLKYLSHEIIRIMEYEEKKGYEEPIKKIAKGAGIIFGGMFLSKVFLFVYRILIARMGVEVYGLFSLSLSILEVLLTIAFLGLDTGIIRYFSYYKAKHDMARAKGVAYFSLKITFFVSLFLTAVLFIFSNEISIYLFHDFGLSSILKIVIFSLPINVLISILFSLMRANQDVKQAVYSRFIFENFSRLALTIILLLLGFKILGVAVAYVISMALTLILIFYYVRRDILSKFKDVKLINPSTNKLLGYSLPLIFNEITVMIFLWVDIFMIGIFLDARSVGIYNVVVPSVLLLYLFSFSLRYLFLPILTELHSQGKKNIFSNIYRISTKWIFGVSIVIFSLFLLVSKEFLGVFFGEAYVAETLAIFNFVLPVSVVTLILLLLGFFVLNVITCPKEVLIIYKKTKLIAFNTIVAAIFNVILNFYLIPIYGIIGAAVATSISIFIWAILITISAYSVTKVNVFGFIYVKIFLSALLALIIAFGFKVLFGFADIFALIIYPVVFLIFYILFLFITRSLEKDDMVIIEALKRKIS
tara:strand:+ start:2601 stop:4208 length:1608 start_codon:yes stop_codon:yes gene_type:complete